MTTQDFVRVRDIFFMYHAKEFWHIVSAVLALMTCYCEGACLWMQRSSRTPAPPDAKDGPFFSVQSSSSLCSSHRRDQPPCSDIPVRLSGDDAGQGILGGGLWWRFSADIFCLVGVKPPFFGASAVTMAATDSAGRTLLIFRMRNSFIYYHVMAATKKKKKYCRAQLCHSVVIM